MSNWKKQQRTDFEASIIEFFKPIDITPDLTPGRLEPANYEDGLVNARWHGYQAGQDDLVGKIQDAFAAIPYPEGHSADSRAHWKAGVKAAIDAVNRALGVGDSVSDAARSNDAASL